MSGRMASAVLLVALAVGAGWLCGSGAMGAVSATRLLDDFETSGLETWRSKSNIRLLTARADGESYLRARIVFSQFDYGWLRKAWSDEPLDARGFDGLRFRLRARGVKRLLVHVMTGEDDEHLTTYEIGKSLTLDSPGWHAITLSWVEFGALDDSRPLESEALSRVRYVNVSAVGERGRSAQVDLDDLALVRLRPETLERLRRSTPAGWAQEAEAEFFTALTYDARRFPGIERVRRALPRRPGAPPQAYAKAKAELLAYLRARAQPVYFLPARERAQTFEAIARQWPRLPGQRRRSADRICEHIFEWEGQRRQLIRPFDWQPGPNEWNAVLNRFGYLSTLADAYRLTGDEKYPREAVALLQDWIAQNPVPARMTRARTWFYLEAGVRCDSWVRAWVDCLDSPAMTPDANYQILRALTHHARWLGWYDRSRVNPNMIIVAAKGLGILGMIFPEFEAAAQWRRDGFETISGLLAESVLPSGAWIEVTPGYHEWVALSCLELFHLARANGLGLPRRGRDRWESMFEWLLRVAQPNGRPPMLGDSGRRTVVGAMSEAALEFGRGDFRFFARPTLVPAQLLRVGPDGAQRYQAIEPQAPPWLSVAMPDCGLYVMRTGWDKADEYLLFDAGPIYSHTHADALSFQMYAYGETLVWDGGTCNYNLPENRAYYYQARAHSLVMIDDLDLRLDGRPVVHRWLSEEGFDFVDAEAAYTNVPVRHRRQILFVKPDYWIIRDTLTGRGPHRFEQQFHLGVDSRPQADAPARVIATDREGPRVWLACVEPREATAELVRGMISYNHGTPGVTSNLEAPVASFRLDADCDAGPVVFVTVMVPLRQGQPPPALERLPPPADGALAFGITREADSDEIVIAGDEPASLGALTLRNQIGVLRAGAAARSLVVPTR